MEEKLTNLLEYKFDEDNPDLQEEYYKILNKVIDACILLRYNDFKTGYDFSSLNQLDEVVLYNFRKINDSNSDFILNNLAGVLTRASSYRKDIVYQKRIFDFLNELYFSYINTNNTLSYELTTDFYNEILNRQQDKFVKLEKEMTIRSILPTLPLTEKKTKTLRTNAKIKKITEMLRNGDNSIIDYELLKNELELLHVYLNKIKPFCKNKKITSEQFVLLDNLFMNGDLTLDNINALNQGFDNEEAKVILKKYHKILFPYLDKVYVSEDEFDYNTVKFNYNHVKILNRDYYYNNMRELFENVNDLEMGYIINNFDNLKDLFKLIPFIDMFVEFDVEDFKNIILNYDHIINNMINTGKIPRDYSFDCILDNLGEVIKLGRAYSSASIYVNSILGEDVICKLLTQRQTSRDPKDYVNTYIDMLRTSKTNIPPISGEVNGYKFECGNNYDINRLLIGKNCHNSCIGPGSVGSEAYYAALTSGDADVLIVTKNNEFVGRSIVFRKNNFIILAPIYGHKGLNKNLYDEEFLNCVSSKFISEADKTLDQLNHVFLVQDSIGSLRGYPVYEDDKFKDDLPHADLSNFVYLLASNEKVIDSKNGYKQPYYKKRKKISCKNNNYLNDILSIRALEICMEEDLDKRSFLESKFLSVDNYERVYIGQDFYVGVLSNGKIDKVSLNTFDLRQGIEIDKVLDDIVSFESKVSDNLLISNIK